MGSAYAIKIKRIGNANLLKDIVFGDNGRIVEFVYFITKINKFYVENFLKGSLIKEFTLVNVVNKKESNVVIERVESGFFFDDLEFSFETLPHLEMVLLISNVKEGTVSFFKGIRKREMILLGTDEKYFNTFLDVETEIKRKNAKFLFYDFCEDKIVSVDFEEFRTNNDEMQMGFECEEISVKEISKIIAELKKEKISFKIKSENISENNLSKEINNNFEIVPGMELIKEEIEIKLNKLTYQSLSPSSKSENKQENERENLLDTSRIEQILIETKNKVINLDNIDQELRSPDTSEYIEEEDIVKNSFYNKEDNETYLSTRSDLDTNNSKTGCPQTNVICIDPKINLVTSSEEYSNKKSPTSINSNDTKYSYSEQNENIERKLNSLTILNTPTNPSRSNKNTKSKYKFTNCKKKYSKHLSIYERIDSNFNFMNNVNIKKGSTEEEINSPEKGKINIDENEMETKPGININSNKDLSIQKKNKKTILIKGFLLSKTNNYSESGIKISDLDKNTIGISIQFKNRNILN